MATWNGEPCSPPQLQYEVLAHEAVHGFACSLEAAAPQRFRYSMGSAHGSGSPSRASKRRQGNAVKNE